MERSGWVRLDDRKVADLDDRVGGHGTWVVRQQFQRRLEQQQFERVFWWRILGRRWRWGRGLRLVIVAMALGIGSRGIALVMAMAALGSPVAAQTQARHASLSEAEVVGRYDYSDTQLAASVVLRADHSFAYELVELAKPDLPQGRFRQLTRGVWALSGGRRIALTNAPTTAPVLTQVSAVSDPSVRAALTIMQGDGELGHDLALRGTDDEDTIVNALPDGRWIVGLYGDSDTGGGEPGSRPPTNLPKTWEIIRLGDYRSLATIALSPGGPNRFTFRYTPSPIAPFHLVARIDADPDVIEVAFGSASIKLHRTAPSKAGR